MASSTPATAQRADAAAAEPTDDPTADLVESDVLVEEVSIDGMCGVY